MYYQHCFDIIDDEIIKEIFSFNDMILESEMYHWYYKHRKTYDVVHLRRGDIARKDFNGRYSMITRDSYIKQINFLQWNMNDIIWISDDISEKTDSPIHKYKSINGHQLSYPVGETFSDSEYFFDFLPDFFLIYFSRRVLRGNSSFSWWACQLGNTVTYSPVVPPKPEINIDKYVETDAEFVKSNSPHFVYNFAPEGHVGDTGFTNIVFTNCINYKK